MFAKLIVYICFYNLVVFVRVAAVACTARGTVGVVILA